MFLSNSYTHESVRSAPGEFNNTLKNLQSYITTVPKVNIIIKKNFISIDSFGLATLFHSEPGLLSVLTGSFDIMLRQ